VSAQIVIQNVGTIWHNSYDETLFLHMRGIEWHDINDLRKAPAKAATSRDVLTWHEIGRRQNLYERLEVSRRASPAAIKRAYRTLIETYHPDRQPEHLRAWAEDVSKQLNEAYFMLKDAERRAAYDQHVSI